MRKLIVDLTVSAGTLPEGHSQIGVPVYREREPGYSSRVLQREFPATQCTPVRELQNSVPENIFFFFATPVLIGNMVN